MDKTIRNKGKSLLKLIKDYTVIDIETTGLDPNYDDIIEISALKIRNDEIIKEYSSLISLDYELPIFITDLTGITNDMLVNDGKKLDIVLKEFLDFIDNDIIVGHNVNFDINFLYDNILKIFNKEFNQDFIDTFRLSRKVLPEMKHHRLIDLTKYYKLNVDGFHRGMYDCLSTKDIYLKLKEDIIKSYGNEDNFLKQITYIKKATDFTTNNTIFDEDNLLFQKNCVFTGTLEKMLRKEAMQRVVDIGGFVQDGVNADTNFLIVGKTDYQKTKGQKSNKIKKVESMILKGKDVQILSEDVFYDLIDDKVTT